MMEETRLRRYSTFLLAKERATLNSAILGNSNAYNKGRFMQRKNDNYNE